MAGLQRIDCAQSEIGIWIRESAQGMGYGRRNHGLGNSTPSARPLSSTRSRSGMSRAAAWPKACPERSSQPRAARAERRDAR
jgi:hypothetical protein